MRPPKPGTKEPLVLFGHVRETILPSMSTERMSRLMAPMTIETMGPGPTIDVDVAFGILPGVHSWISHIKQGIRIRLRSVEDRQLIYFPGIGRVEADTPDGTLTCDDRHGLNVEVAGVPEVRFSPGRDGVGLAIDRPALVQRLAELLDAPIDRRLVFAPRFEAAIGTRKATEDMVRALSSPMLGAAMTASPATASRLSVVILDLVLQSLPHNYSADLAKPPRRIAPRHVKQATEYIRANARSPISIDELAELCQVSVRSLHYGFRQFLDTSPAEYLRARRLEGARQDILADPDSPIARIASAWGFTNTTRFAALFKASYGETPQEFRLRRDRNP